LENLTKKQLLQFKKYLNISILERILFDFIRDNGIFCVNRGNENKYKASSSLGISFKAEKSIQLSLKTEELSKKTGVSEISIEKALKKLVKMRWLSKNKIDLSEDSMDRYLSEFLGIRYTVAPSIVNTDFRKILKELEQSLSYYSDLTFNK